MPTFLVTNLAMPKLRLIELIAACPTFRTAVCDARYPSETPSSDLARTSIYTPWASDRFEEDDTGQEIMEHPYPRINVQQEDWSWPLKGIAHAGNKGTLSFFFEFLPDSRAAGDVILEHAYFEETVGLILQEMAERRGADKGAGETFYSTDETAHLAVGDLRMLIPPGLEEPKEQGGRSVYAAGFALDYF